MGETIFTPTDYLKAKEEVQEFHKVEGLCQLTWRSTYGHVSTNVASPNNSTCGRGLRVLDLTNFSLNQYKDIESITKKLQALLAK